MKLLKWFGFISVLLLAACSGDAGNEGSDVSFDAVASDIVEQVEADLKEMDQSLTVTDVYYHLNLKEVDDSDPAAAVFVESLQINDEELANGMVLAPMMNINSDEIIFLEAKDASHVESLKTTLENELAAQDQTWSEYLPDQYEKVKNNIVKTNGNFLIYITYEHPEKIEEIFDKHFE